MSAKRVLLAVCVVLCGAFAAVRANDRSFDFTARLLSTPLADPVPAPDLNHFRIGVVGGRWHFRDNDYSVNVTSVGVAAAYTRFFDPHLGFNLHLNADRAQGINSPFDFIGYGLEGGVDAVYGLMSKPSKFGPNNGSSVFAGLLAWEGRWDGHLHDLVFGATGRQDLKADLLTYLFRAGWQGKFYVAPRASLEPAFYLYMQNHARRVMIDTLNSDDDANPTSFGAAVNINAAFGDLLMNGDGLSAGAAGAWTIDHNISYQFQLSYTFGAFNADPDAN